MKEAFDAVGGSPNPGNRLDQVFLLDGSEVVEDYLGHLEYGLAFDHLIYMITQPDLKISDATYALIVEIRRRLNRDPGGGDQMRWAGLPRQFVDMNGAMRALDPPRLSAFDARRHLDPRLADVLSGGFEERNGCIVLASQVGSVDRLRLKAFDETETEAIANHVHVEDVLASVSHHETVPREEVVRASPSETLQQTMAHVACLQAGLIDGRPDDAFHIVVAVRVFVHRSVLQAPVPTSRRSLRMTSTATQRKQ